MLIALRLFASGQHAAGCGDVIAPGTSDRGGDVVINQNLLKCQNPILVRSFEWDPRVGIEGNEIDLLSESGKQLYQAVSVGGRVVDPIDQYVFKSDPAASFEGKIPAGLEQRGYVPLLVDGDQHIPDFVGRGI